MAWTYSDWVTEATGSTTRLSKLRLHIQEVSDAIQSGDFAVQGLSVSKSSLQSYLSDLKADEEKLASQADKASGRTVGWSRAKARLY